MSRDVAILGAGYVGLPLAIRFADAGRRVVCIDPDASKIARLNAGESYIGDVAGDVLAAHVQAGTLVGSTDPAQVATARAVVICVPTPLTENREPDLSAVIGATVELAAFLRQGHLVVLESTTYPGTTRDVLLPILERGGLTCGVDFHLAFSPERIDPGRTDYTVQTTPKVVGGITPACAEAAAALYGGIVDSVVRVTTPEAAELTKLLENIFRSVNIALVNELAMMCDRMGIDIWEVIDAAASKPFGFMPFKPGPGLGGHCLPLDPFYLSWKAREFDFYTEFIELAGKVNENMPRFCVQKLNRALNRAGKPLNGSEILLLGVAYKGDIDDTRESPALELVELLREEGARVSYADPHVPSLPDLGLDATPLTPDALAACDCAVIVTAHSGVDYAAVVEHAPLVLDLRNATASVGGDASHVWKL